MTFRFGATALLGSLLAASLTAHASFVDEKDKSVTTKVVYVGGVGTPRRANLEFIYAKTNTEMRGKAIIARTDPDASGAYDFLPVSLGEIRGYKVNMHLYTSPGQPSQRAARQLLMKGIDGVVFVADSDSAQNAATLALWNEVKQSITKLGYLPATVAIVVQLTSPHPAKGKTQSAAEVRELLGLTSEPVIEADPAVGIGVFDTLKAVTKLVLQQLRKPQRQ